jgi:hypothetical protein
MEVNGQTTATPDTGPQADSLRPVQRFLKIVIRATFLVILVAALAAYPFDPTATHGILLGGFAGILGFWLMARRIQKLASVPSSKIKLEVYKATVFRLILYALVLGKAYTLDPDTFVGFLSAIGGILVIRLVVVLVGITSLDFRQPQHPE